MCAIPFSIVLEEIDQLFRVDVLVMGVCSWSDESEDVFCHEDGKEPREWGASDGGHEEVSAWFDE